MRENRILYKKSDIEKLMTQINEFIHRKHDKSPIKCAPYNRALIDESIIGLALCKMNGQLVDVNPTFAAIIGRTVDEALNLSYWEITPDKYAEEEKAQLESIQRTGRYDSYEKEYLHADGHLVPVRLSGQILEINGEKFIWSSVEDITRYKQAEKALKRSEVLELLAKGASLRKILTALAVNAENYNPEMICTLLLLDESGKYLSYCAAPSLPDYFINSIGKVEISSNMKIDGGIGAAALSGKRVLFEDIVDHPQWLKYRELALKVGLRTCWSEPIISSTGNILGTFDIFYRRSKLPSQLDLNYIVDSERIASIAIERKQADEKIRTSEYEHRKVLASLRDVYCQTDSNGIIVMVSPSSLEVTGYTPDELIGNPIEKFWRYPEKRVDFLKALSDGNGFANNYEMEGVRKDGSITWGSVNAHLIFDEDGKMTGIIGTLRDCTKRKRREQELARFKAILDQTKDCVFMFHPDSFKFFYVNQGAVEQTEYEKNELLGMTPLDIKPDLQEFGFRQLLRPLVTGEMNEQTFVTQYHTKDGRLIPVDILLQFVKLNDEDSCFVAIVRDITERNRVRDQARQHQADLAHMARLNTMGEMATGIAHEINQPLAAINNYAAAGLKMLKMGVKSPALLMEALEGISFQAIRAGEIIRRLRQLVKKQEPKKTYVVLNDLIKEVLKLLHLELKKQNIELKCDLPGQSLIIYADAIQIEQVIINLLHNALEAMEPITSQKHRLTIKTSLKKHGLIEMEVKDSGLGISDEILERIFEPFVTTKGAKGMGMGLAISRSIIEAHGGQLWARSAPECGTSFFFTIPLKEL